MSDICLSHVNLPNVNMSNVNMSNVNLSNANVSNVDLSYVSLSIMSICQMTVCLCHYKERNKKRLKLNLNNSVFLTIHSSTCTACNLTILGNQRVSFAKSYPKSAHA